MMRSVLIMAGALVVAILWVNWRGPLFPKVQQINIITKDMNFMVVSSAGDTVINPPLEFYGGERITFLVRNADPGIVHNFAITALKVKTRDLVYGQTERLTVKMPAGPAIYDYVCSLHVLMKMKGRIIINPKKPKPARLTD